MLAVTSCLFAKFGTQALMEAMIDELCATISKCAVQFS